MHPNQIEAPGMCSLRSGNGGKKLRPSFNSLSLAELTKMLSQNRKAKAPLEGFNHMPETSQDKISYSISALVP